MSTVDDLERSFHAGDEVTRDGADDLVVPGGRLNVPVDDPPETLATWKITRSSATSSSPEMVELDRPSRMRLTQG